MSRWLMLTQQRKLWIKDTICLETCHLVCNDLTCMYCISYISLFIVYFFSYDVMLLLFNEEFFKDCGEVVDVRFSVDDTGRFKRFGHVEFAIAEVAQSALELNEHELLNRPVRLDLARERGSYIPGGSNFFQKGDQCQTGQTLYWVLINLLEKR
ncbi:nucleolin 2-like isoform X1 [Arachis stenosperma]|uniref:nucleolin 2-like isoform X1 n=1 Tax=Arachis stenosperma TaxID=217475 RepID=UPI0025ACEF6A|nr:nucleolin 2-like isoform X1 [Arachis stenosperma]XP_057721816.1 nucleolin 2-like isoform X1 [Arachis stenosperma]XP_057721817.1 nucleolin 2-like isoform X1 [Arachis stenosperma]XP_057721818.1 nucleolin 2-like isoform X1 [Arachis stenosperma]XP_057721819.1 nucleolin 2-like isoform X1 [Arachis stenosperma]XP_057721821.1 nucleolin 2-like isoform X1 [Arachis stenosperma]